MNTLQSIAAFIVALGVLIVVHEYGHYLAARLFNVKVLRFSVGFGRSIYVRRSGADGTEWVIAAIPLGGYVKMLDEREAPVAPEDQARAFNRQSVGRRFAIVMAGPLFNFAFAVAVYAALFMVGLPEAKPVLAPPAAGSLAAAAGLRGGDTVRALDGEPVQTWQDMRWRILQAALERRTIALERVGENGRVDVLQLDLREFVEPDSDVMERIGLRLFRPALAPVIGRVVSGSPGERAGLRTGDRVTHIDGQRIDTWEQLVERVRERPGRALELTLERNGSPARVDVIPESVAANDTRIGRIGAAPLVPESHNERVLIWVRYGPLESLGKAVVKTADVAVFSLRMLGRMLLGEVSWKHLSGPVTIADYAGQSAQLGWAPYLTFLALISISLGVLNLLPIPLLDGGHLMYYLIEIVKGGPLSERSVELGQRVGLALLLIMMAFALYNDLNRLFSG